MRPRYDWQTNNCHKFVIELLNRICDPGRDIVLAPYKWFSDEDDKQDEEDEGEVTDPLSYIVSLIEDAIKPAPGAVKACAQTEEVQDVLDNALNVMKLSETIGKTDDWTSWADIF
jgi:hypothetical protein